MRKIWEKMKKPFLAGAVAGVLVFLVYAMYSTYSAYTHMIIRQQQEHLLLVSHAVSQSLEVYISDQLRQASILTQTPGFLDAVDEYNSTGEQERIKEYIYSYMLSNQQGPSRMYLLDRQGRQIVRYNQYPFLEEFDEDLLHLDECAGERENGIGGIFQISKNHYGITLVNSVYGGSGYVGSAVSIFDMEDIYKRFVVPLSMSNLGFITVKDGEGTIIMHPVKNMLGFNPAQDIDGFGTLSQYRTQRDMLKDQYAQEEGTGIYQSYSDGIMPPDKKITAFSRMNLWGSSWYISAEIPYSQALSTGLDSLRKFSLLFFAILIVVVGSGAAIYVLMRNRQKLTLETRYLKEINGTLEELHQSREEARHYQKLTTIGTLVGGIAHEFNNLLTPILGYSEFIKERMEPENEYYEDIEEIHKAGVRAKEIVEQVLPFSRKETDTTGFCSINVDVVIHDAIKMIKLIVPSNIAVKEKITDEGVNVYGNATQIHQVLLNLFSNAIQSMDEKGGVLTVETRYLEAEELPDEYRKMQGEDYVEIMVTDTGCGMDANILNQIFNPFFTTKAAGEGTGLGLSVVKGILINHSGFIRAESRAGEGSRFCIYLPISTGGNVIQAVVAEVKREKAGEASVILIDDELRVIKYLTKRMTKKGYRVDGFTDPEKALEALEREPGRWDVAVIDYMMPQFKGTVLAQRMKIRRPDLGVMMITGLVEADALQMWREGVIEKILLKPVNFEELSAAVESAARGKSGE